MDKTGWRKGYPPQALPRCATNQKGSVGRLSALNHKRTREELGMEGSLEPRPGRQGFIYTGRFRDGGGPLRESGKG